MPLLDLSTSKNKGGLRGSGAVTDRPKYCKTKALSDHKRPWESSDGSCEHARLDAGVFNRIVNLGDFSAFHETRSMAAQHGGAAWRRPQYRLSPVTKRTEVSLLMLGRSRCLMISLLFHVFVGLSISKDVECEVMLSR